MILAAVTTVRAWWTALPTALRWFVALAVVAVLLFIAVALWIRSFEREVIERHEQQREIVGSKAREKSAEEAVVDALTAQWEREQRDRAIAEAALEEAEKPVEERATTPPQALALNCAIAREDYTPAELAKMEQYQEHCR
jgi:flagellar biosynthesis/type III secretory pathway M-ring protein FliF/YscJ